MSFNELSDSEAERLALLCEELGEATQAIGKILRHGYKSFNPDKPESDNRSDLHRELGDILAAMEIMIESGDLKRRTLDGWKKVKLIKVYKYLHHNRKRKVNEL